MPADAPVSAELWIPYTTQTREMLHGIVHVPVRQSHSSFIQISVLLVHAAQFAETRSVTMQELEIYHASSAEKAAGSCSPSLQVMLLLSLGFESCSVPPAYAPPEDEVDRKLLLLVCSGS